jgi:hypothetical protein
MRDLRIARVSFIYSFARGVVKERDDLDKIAADLLSCGLCADMTSKMTMKFLANHWAET